MSLAEKAISGAKWSAVSQFGRQGLGFAVTAVLVRLLSPDAYGLLGMAVVITGFVDIFKDLGTSSALIQRKELSDKLISGIFWLNLLFGLLSTGIIVLIAPWVALFYRDARVIPILRVLSFSLVVSGASIAQQALLTRQMAFDKLARIELMSVAVGAVVGLGMAASGMGVWSLVGQTLCQSVITTILLWIASPWRPQRRVDWIQVRSVASYSLNLSGFNVLNYFVRNADHLLIGRYLGATPLGYYSLAYRLMLYPVQNISGALGRVLFPAFAQMQDDHSRFRQAYLRLCASTSLITFPMMLGLFIVARPLVAAIFGDRWAPVAALLMILAPVGMAQSIATTVGHIYMGRGRTDWMFRWGVVSGLVVVLFFVVGLRWGVVGVAIAYAVSTALLTPPGYAIPFRLIGLPLRHFARSLWPSLRGALVMSAAVLAVRVALSSAGINQAWVVVGVAVMVGASIYGGLLLWWRPPALRDVLHLLPIGRLVWLRG
jgi:PST family polysaccharide transporter